MTYPQQLEPARRSTQPAARAAESVAELPRDRDRHARVLEAATTPSAASIDQREGAPEWVFYDGPPFANGLPHYGHLLTGYAKDLFPRFQTMRGKQVHRALRLGHPRPARRARGDAAARHHREGRDRGDGHRRLQREGPRVGARVHQRVAGVRHPPGALGRLRERLQDARHHLHGVGASGRSSAHDKGLAYEGYRVLPYCWRDETPLSNHELRMDDDVYKMRQDQSVTVTFPLVGAKAEALGLTARARPGLDDDAVDPADEPRARRRPRHRVRGRPGGPPAPPTCTASDGRRAARRRRTEYLLADDTARATTPRTSATSRAEAARAAVEPHASSGAELEGVHYDRLLDYYADAETWGTAERLADPRRRLRHDRRRHRHRAPGARLRRGRPARLRGRRHPGHHAPSTTAAGSCPQVDGCRRACRCSTRTSRSPSCCARRAGCCAGRELRALATRTAGAAATR